MVHCNHMKSAIKRYCGAGVTSHEICIEIFHQLCNHEILWFWGLWYFYPFPPAELDCSKNKPLIPRINRFLIILLYWIILRKAKTILCFWFMCENSYVMCAFNEWVSKLGYIRLKAVKIMIHHSLVFLLPTHGAEAMPGKWSFRSSISDIANMGCAVRVCYSACWRSRKIL